MLSVLFAPYMITVAGEAAGCVDPDETCAARPSACSGSTSRPGSLPFYLTSFATISSAFVLPVVGAFVDRSHRKKWHMGTYAWAGAFFCALLFFMQGESWQLGAVSIVLASMLAGCSLVSYYAILVDISTEDERDHVSSRGWAFGYLGGGLLLASTSRGLPRPRHFGLGEGWPSGSRCCRRRCGGPGSRSSRWCACATTRRATWSGRGSRSSSAASGSSSRR